MRLLNEEQQKWVDVIGEFCKKEIEPIMLDWDKVVDPSKAIPFEAYDKAFKLGLNSFEIPKEYGGAGCDYLTYALLIEEFARQCSVLSIYANTSNSLGGGPLMLAGNEEQKKKYLPPLASGEKIIAFALTEPNAGTDAAGQQTIALKNENGDYVLNGSKCFITNGTVAETFVVFAMTDKKLGNKGISAFIVSRDAEGFHVGSHEDKMGLRGTTTGDMSFDNVYLPPDALLGKVGEGFRIAMSALDGARISISAVATGLAYHAMDLARIYANERVAFKQPIAALGGIQSKFADMSARIRAMELMVYDAALMKDRDIYNTVEAAQTKLLCSTWATQIALEAMQIMGGNGCSREYHVERFVRDAKMLEVAEGTTEILKISIGRNILAQKK